MEEPSLMQFSLTGPLTDVDAAWALLGDTELLARLAGSPSVEMEIRPDSADYPEVRGRFIGPSVIRHDFVEPDSRWVHHKWFEQVRVIEGPFMRKMRYRARLEAQDGGVVPHVDFSVDFAHLPATWFGGGFVRATERAWKQALSLLPAPGDISNAAHLRSLPAPVARAVEAWRQRDGVPTDLVDRVSLFLQTARAPDLNRIRPFVLADTWGLERDIVLIAFLEGVLAGAFELVWVSRCPRCTAGVSRADSLSDLADHAACASCRISFSPSLDDDVEVVFAAHPAIRPPPGETFCTLYPIDRPEVRAMLTVAAGASETVRVPLTAGTWRLGSGGEQEDQVLTVGAYGAASHAWSPSALPSVALLAGEVELSLHNPTDGRLRVQLAGRPDLDRVVSAARLATFPAYRHRFGPSALATDVRLSVRSVAVLFTDLSGSAALYDAHGDGAAFALVHAHFRILDEVVSETGGARVKTIGDALMAAFSDPLDAVRAGLEMQRRFQVWAQTLSLDTPPGLKVGIHWGPAMAVHTDQAGLDWFGGTVNLAARCEGQARAGEVIWTADVHDRPGLLDMLAHEAVSFECYDAQVKGITKAVGMVRVTV